MITILSFLIGLFLGLAIMFVVTKIQSQSSQDLAKDMMKEDMEKVIAQMKDSFKALSSDVLSESSKSFLTLANETLSKQVKVGEGELEGRKKLIDQNLENMEKQLKTVTDKVSEYQKESKNIFGEVSAKIEVHAQQTQKLQDTTNKLQSVLASTKSRGQWGERMAEDVLRLAGFIEGINYRKQKSLDAGSKRPDFSFILPNNTIVNMDVKFPLNSYLYYYAADNESDKKTHKEQFLRDVKARIKEVTTRDYINPEDNTVDYVIVFIPNEQVYAFINEADNSILDDALKNKVIFCSPLTLYAILAVIRQAMDSFKLEKTAAEMTSLLGSFNKQWQMYVRSMDKMGKSIEDVQKEYQNLISTRRNQLERPLNKIEDLRVSRGIPMALEDANILEE